jgi:hypothetical protein
MQVATQNESSGKDDMQIRFRRSVFDVILSSEKKCIGCYFSESK